MLLSTLMYKDVCIIYNLEMQWLELNYIYQYFGWYKDSKLKYQIPLADKMSS